MLRRLVVCIALLVAATAPAIAEDSAAPQVTPSVAAWKQDISIRLRLARRYPPTLARGQGGTATVAFRIDRAGHLVSSWLIESSGIPVIDAEALAIVERAQPFAALPADVRDDTAVLTVPFNFGAMPAPSLTESNPVPPRDDPALKAKLNSICRGC
ncbi:energy transducer TonB [Bradyrhizobium sp. BRP56]|uniref:energy transducer TonB family protein n=1 Tax=Bradyrhizobium sp. BRP56 TaxID=2793819 RepID=UPI001CD2C2E3|nr:energy transducer TonB [Bradyrhizobium sp. BRP56]MCA1398195.1 energy transducer TonB [Bradyrhizobium sp. BRP56]